MANDYGVSELPDSDLAQALQAMGQAPTPENIAKYRAQPSLFRGFVMSRSGATTSATGAPRVMEASLKNVLQSLPWYRSGADTGAPAAAPGAAVAQTRPSYLGAAPQISMGTAGTSGGAAGGAAGGGGGATTMADGSNPYTIIRNPITGRQMARDQAGSYYDINPQTGAFVPRSDAEAVAAGLPSAYGEVNAQQQMGQIDPASEALRQQLAQSYATPLQQAGAPTAGQFQSNLDVYRQIDPTGAAAREKLGSDLAAQEALGTQLDAATQREVEQATRRGQAARGNVYGTPQLVQEAMTRGQAGLALQQQRQQALQSYLSSGQTTGDVAMSLYNQQQQQLRAAQGAAVGYLGSGQTPYQAGASYLNLAEQRAAAAAQGGPQYNPAALGQQYTGAGAPSFPQYGLDVSQLAGNWYNNINAANMQAAQIGQAGKAQGSQRAGALGAGIGSALGGVVGSFVPGIGTAIGAGLGGALGGAAGGYFG